MKITASNLGMLARHRAIEQHESRETLRMWVASQPVDNRGGAPLERRASQVARADSVELSARARSMRPTKETAPVDAEITPEDELKISLLIKMIEALTGKTLKFASPREFRDTMAQVQEQAQATAGDLQRAQAGGSSDAPAGFGIEYDAYERHYEAERTTFAAAGVVETADGREIAFSVDLSMSREFLSEQRISVRAGDAPAMKDPLVLNFGGNAAELTGTRFSFDIDADGRFDQIAFVGPDSGFLAIDRNRDGAVTDGSELFGATTGDGFAELAAADRDGNGWIDENDSIYGKLRIWSKTADGQDQLVALGERGVGAIYLGHVSTPFALKDAGNETLGQIRSSGVFLTEQGGTGTIQQIDLAV